MKKMLFVVNPNAGLKKAGKYLMEIVDIFNRADYEVSVYITQKQGDARNMVAQRAAGMDAVVCCGGDGTFNETVTGMLSAGLDVPLGYIPAGSTNDFANSLKLPLDPLEAAQNIVQGQPVAYDVGRFEDRYFSYVASFGAFTRTSYTTPQSIKNALGHTAYVLNGISEISQIRQIQVKMELDGQELEDKFLFGAICNSTSVGGILTLDPNQVDMRDGKFELLLVRAPKDLAELNECVWAMQRQEYNCKMITFCSAAKVRVLADPGMPWTLDGEKEEGHSVVEVENIHHAIKLMKRE